jgi:hypothetical protein
MYIMGVLFTIFTYCTYTYIYTFITDKCKQLSERYRHTICFTRSPLPLLRGQVIKNDTIKAGLNLEPVRCALVASTSGAASGAAARRPSPAPQYLRNDSGGQFCMRYRVGAAMQCGWEIYLCSKSG